LESEGFDVLQAGDVREARSRLEGAERSVDLALVDLVLPGPSGWDLLRWLRGSHPSVHLVAVTGRPDLDPPRDFRPPAQVLRLEKPFNPLQLVETVRRVAVRR
jgi:DNA-binding response OmpR family regulator